MVVRFLCTSTPEVGVMWENWSRSAMALELCRGLARKPKENKPDQGGNVGLSELRRTPKGRSFSPSLHVQSSHTSHTPTSFPEASFLHSSLKHETSNMPSWYLRGAYLIMLLCHMFAVDLCGQQESWSPSAGSHGGPPQDCLSFGSYLWAKKNLFLLVKSKLCWWPPISVVGNFLPLALGLPAGSPTGPRPPAGPWKLRGRCMSTGLCKFNWGLVSECAPLKRSIKLESFSYS